MSTPSKILIIGGNGFLGSHIIDSFKAHDWPVPLHLSVLDIRLPETKKPGIKYLIGDITKAYDLRTAFEEIDLIIHTASPIHDAPKEIQFKVNVQGTKTVIEVAKEMGIRGLVYTSSAGVVFNGGDLVNVSEDAPIPTKMDAYNESKAQAEAAVLAANTKLFKTCALRPAGLFGEGDRQMIPGMMNAIENKQTRFQVGDNNNLFDFTYIENAALAHVLAAKRLTSPPTDIYTNNGDPSNGVEGEAFFITNGSPVYFMDFPRTIWSYYIPTPSFYYVVPKSLAMVMGYLAEWAAWFQGKEPSYTRYRVQLTCAQRYYNINKARERLEYHPSTTLEEGIKKSLAWLKESKAKQSVAKFGTKKDA